MKSSRFFRCRPAVLLAALSVLMLCGGLPPALAQSPHDPVPIDDYVLVCMAHEYSFPEEDYPPEYFHAAYVRETEGIFTYQEGDLADKDTFYRIEKLTLTEQGKENIDRFIAELNVRKDVLYAGRDYLCPDGDGPFGFVPGDADRDGVISPADARQALRWAVKLDDYLREDVVRCDMDGDEALTPADARLILRRSVQAG